LTHPCSRRTRMSDIRILIAEDHRLFCEGLRLLLNGQPGFRVVGEALDGSTALRLVKQVKSDILLLDYDLENVSSMEVLGSLSSQATELHPIVLAGDIERKQAAEAYRLGAKGVILKEAATTFLFNCIRSVVAGKYWVLNEAISDLSKFERYPGFFGRKSSSSANYQLTRREMQILRAVIAGKRNREIAELFSISEQTVKHHISNIFDKVGVYNRLELVLFAVYHGLVGEPSKRRIVSSDENADK
jgi:two-component system nitrate/nitrite response regulator NarL